MRLIGIILRIVLILFIIRMIVVFFRGLNAGRRSGPAPSARAAERLGGALVRDPQCGTYIPRGNAITALVAGKMEYFCSITCRDKALGARAH